MNSIIPPRTAGIYPDRDLDCEEAMNRALLDLLDRASVAGWAIPECLDAIERTIPHQRNAYERDPDPVDDPVAATRDAL